MRENGYYWVRDGEAWVIAEFLLDHWYYCWNEIEYYETDFDEIGEKVERKEKQ